jgi:hypothetical protein
MTYDLKKLAALEARYNGPIPEHMLEAAKIKEGGMGKHTPGPWDWDAGDIGNEYSIRYCTVSKGAGDLIIAEVNDVFSIEEGRANAALIAAAPDMKDALKLMVRDNPPSSEGRRMYNNLAALDAARAALAKAEGKS